LLGFCKQNINDSGLEYNITIVYNTTPSYENSTATLSCKEGYVLTEAGSAVCGKNEEWDIKYPKCEGTMLMFACSLQSKACYLVTFSNYFKHHTNM